MASAVRRRWLSAGSRLTGFERLAEGARGSSASLEALSFEAVAPTRREHLVCQRIERRPTVRERQMPVGRCDIAARTIGERQG
jgi:hypothetical protein